MWPFASQCGVWSIHYWISFAIMKENWHFISYFNAKMWHKVQNLPAFDKMHAFTTTMITLISTNCTLLMYSIDILCHHFYSASHILKLPTWTTMTPSSSPPQNIFSPFFCPLRSCYKPFHFNISNIIILNNHLAPQVIHQMSHLDVL